MRIIEHLIRFQLLGITSLSLNLRLQIYQPHLLPVTSDDIRQKYPSICFPPQPFSEEGIYFHSEVENLQNASTVLSSGLLTLHREMTSDVLCNFTSTLRCNRGLRHSSTIVSSHLPILFSGSTSYVCVFHHFAAALPDTTEVYGILSPFHLLTCWHCIQGQPASVP